MKIAGIIAEYNPFHSGHAYHIAETRRQTGADYVVVVMSGDFVQRGEPAILDKYTRTEMALSCGADLVIELPVSYATASAERFAWGAVSILHALGCVDTIVCGAEPVTMEVDVVEVAKILIEEPEYFRSSLLQSIKEGASYPAAREKALLDYYKSKEAVPFTSAGENCSPNESMDIFHRFLASPNSILALEYAKAILRLKSGISLTRIERKGNYHDVFLAESAEDQILYSSATAIRNRLLNHSSNPTSLNSNTDIPEKAAAILWDHPFFMSKEDFSALLGYALLTNKKDILTRYQDISEDLANRITARISHYQNWSSFTEELTSRQYASTHIDRALLHILLGIHEDHSGRNDYPRPAYARILGFCKESTALLTEIKKKTAIPMITKLADADFDLPGLNQDIQAAHIYETVRANVYHVSTQNEYKKGLVIL